jgi:hypothetical protein
MDYFLLYEQRVDENIPEKMGNLMFRLIKPEKRAPLIKDLWY